MVVVVLLPSLGVAAVLRKQKDSMARLKRWWWWWEEGGKGVA